jgi:hypothetical protein
VSPLALVQTFLLCRLIHESCMCCVFSFYLFLHKFFHQEYILLRYLTKIICPYKLFSVPTITKF